MMFLIVAGAVLFSLGLDFLDVPAAACFLVGYMYGAAAFTCIAHRVFNNRNRSLPNEAE